MKRQFIFVIVFMSLCLTSVAQDSLRLSMSFVGDIMQHDSQIRASWDSASGKYDYTKCFEAVKPVLSKADVTIGNLELTFGGPPYKGYPQFSAPDELAPALRDAGFDVLVTANNHSQDRGRSGLERTLRILDDIGMPHTGTFADTVARDSTYPFFIEKNGFVVALLNYTYGTNGNVVRHPNIVNKIDTIQIATDLQLASLRNPDAIIVFFHWGAEYQRKQNTWQEKLAAFCFAHGARMVIGSHPHVIQPMEYNPTANTLVAYSLGNFISAQPDRYRNGGVILNVELVKVNGGPAVIRRPNYVPVFVYRDFSRRRLYRMVPAGSELTQGDSRAKEKMQQFLSDTREHLNQWNKGVGEYSGSNKK